jgi:hypothetical protein
MGKDAKVDPGADAGAAAAPATARKNMRKLKSVPFNKLPKAEQKRQLKVQKDAAKYEKAAKKGAKKGKITVDEWKAANPAPAAEAAPAATAVVAKDKASEAEVDLDTVAEEGDEAKKTEADDDAKEGETKEDGAEEKEGGAEEDGAAAKKTEAGDDAKEGETTEGGAKEDGAAAKGAGNRMPGRALSKKVRSVPRAHALHPWHHPDVDTHMCLHDARRQ